MRKFLLLLFPTAIVVAIACKARTSQTKSDEAADHRPDISEIIVQCGSDVQCLGLAIADVLTYQMGTKNLNVEGLKLAAFEDTSCKKAAFVLKGHEGPNFERYCFLKTAGLGNVNVQSFKYGETCQVRNAMQPIALCGTMAAEVRKGEAPVELHWTKACDKIAGFIGHRGFMTVAEYCKTKGASVVGTVEAVKIGAECLKIENTPFVDACLQFAI
ncbi:MAG: hypothetical protein AB7T49_05000 [Oligoflexales bacterium]